MCIFMGFLPYLFDQFVIKVLFFDLLHMIDLLIASIGISTASVNAIAIKTANTKIERNFCNAAISLKYTGTFDELIVISITDK